MARQLCRLHKSTCSLVHWLRVEGNPALMPGCFDTDLCFYDVRQNIFSKNIAFIKGGAIFYDF